MAKTPEIDLRDLSTKNWIINGAMEIAQRGTSFVAFAGGYTLDRWNYTKSGAMVHTISQDTDVPTFSESGVILKNSLRLNLTTPDTAIATGDAATVHYRVEGYDFANFHRKPITLSFWVKATLTGIYCVSFRNGANDLSYVVEYTINAPNTWEKKSITIETPSSGVWDFVNGTGMRITWTLSAGTTFQTTANSWNSGGFVATANQVNGTNTGATDFRLTGVMLSESPDILFRPFGVDFNAEVRACLRYYEKGGYSLLQPPGTAGVNGCINASATSTAAGSVDVYWPLLVEKRATPSFTLYNPSSGAIGTLSGTGTPAGTISGNAKGARISNNGATTTTANYSAAAVADAELS